MTQGPVPFVNVQYALLVFNFRDFTFKICKNLQKKKKNEKNGDSERGVKGDFFVTLHEN